MILNQQANTVYIPIAKQPAINKITGFKFEKAKLLKTRGEAIKPARMINLIISLRWLN